MKKLVPAVVTFCVFCIFYSFAYCDDNSSGNAPAPSENIKVILQDGTVSTGTFVGDKGDKVFLEGKDEKALIIKKSDVTAAYDADTGREIVFSAAATPTPVVAAVPKNPPSINEKLKIVLKNGKKTNGTFIGKKNGKIFLETAGGKAKIIQKQDIAAVYDAATGEELIIFPDTAASIGATATATPTSTPMPFITFWVDGSLVSGWLIEETKDSFKIRHKNGKIKIYPKKNIQSTPTVEAKPSYQPTIEETPTYEPTENQTPEYQPTSEVTPPHKLHPAPTKTPPNPKTIPPLPWTPQVHFGIEFGTTGLAMAVCNQWLNDDAFAWNMLGSGTGAVVPISTGYYFALNMDNCFTPLLAWCMRLEYINSYPTQGIVSGASAGVSTSLMPLTFGLCFEPRIGLGSALSLMLKAGYYIGYGLANISSAGNGSASGGGLVSEILTGFSFGPFGFNFGYRWANIAQVSYQGATLTDELTGNIVSYDFSGGFLGIVATF